MGRRCTGAGTLLTLAPPHRGQRRRGLPVPNHRRWRWRHTEAPPSRASRSSERPGRRARATRDFTSHEARVTHRHHTDTPTHQSAPTQLSVRHVQPYVPYRLVWVCTVRAATGSHSLCMYVSILPLLVPSTTLPADFCAPTGGRWLCVGRVRRVGQIKMDYNRIITGLYALKTA